MGAGKVMRWFRPFLTRKELDRIEQAVTEAERGTSGEIHVHLAGPINSRDPLELARKAFFALGLDKTERRNGVIIFISDFDHAFAIWGDEGIHKAAGQRLWDEAAEVLRRKLKDGEPAEGLIECVREVGEALARLFPKRGGDANELPDRVSRPS